MVTSQNFGTQAVAKRAVFWPGEEIPLPRWQFLQSGFASFDYRAVEFGSRGETGEEL